MSRLKHDWTTQTSSYGGFGTRPRPHAIKIIQALHKDVLHRDGWTSPPSPLTVRTEHHMHPGAPVFVRTKATGRSCGIGMFRGDADEGRAVAYRGARVSRSWSDGDSHTGAIHHALLEFIGGWSRAADGGTLTLERAESGRYDLRPPTNRKRKRERCKGRRRERLDGE